MAFYGGIEKEGSLIMAKFKELVRHQVKLLNTQWRFAMWQVPPTLLPCLLTYIMFGTQHLLFLAHASWLMNLISLITA